jgi:hypothetical protein
MDKRRADFELNRERSQMSRHCFATTSISAAFFITGDVFTKLVYTGA